METSLQRYLDGAVSVLQKYGIMPKEEESQLATILQEVSSIDEPRVLVIAKTVQYMGTFNELVRDNVQDMKVGTRYAPITKMFDSIRDDAKGLVSQLDDGKISTGEKMHNLWMKLARGSPHKRFEKIRDIYVDVSKDTKEQLGKEQEIMDAYIDFRFALKNAEILSQDVLKIQTSNLENAKQEFTAESDKFSQYSGTDGSEKSQLQLSRDESKRRFDVEDRKYQLIKDIAENLSVGYNVGETLVLKLKQTHDLKERVYERAVTFFTTNEHVFTTLDAVYTSQLGLNETTQTLEAMEEGVNKGLESVAELGNKLEKAALKAGYGSTLNSQSVQKLVDAIVSFQIESIKDIEMYRKESEANAKEIGMIVEDGKRKCLEAMTNYIEFKPKEVLALPANSTQ